MVNPQREHGHLDVANELAEAFARIRLNSTQSCIVWVVLRQTYGWNKTLDTISVGQFADATDLPKDMIKRELRRLVERNILRAWGDDHHPKKYGIQKDYTRWLDDRSDRSKVGSKTSPPAAAEVGSKTSQSGVQNVPQVGSKTSPTITTSKNQGETDPHGSGTLRDRYEAKYQSASNKGAVIGELFSLLLGGTPDYRRLGSMTKELNSGGKLMDLIIDASKQRISDDPHDYLAAMVKRHKAERRQGKQGQADLNSGKSNKFVQ